jgi:hypothetical protein
MTTTTAAATTDLFAEATAAALAFKATRTANKEAAESAFRTSALATYNALAGKQAASAKKLAEANKAAGAGYGSPAAVGFHSLTGRALTHLSPATDDDGNEMPFSAQRLQTLIKKVGQETAKALIGKASDLADYAVRLGEAYEAPVVDMTKALQQALDLVAKVEEQRLLGNALPTEAEAIVATLTASLAVISATDEDDEDEDDQPESDEQIDPALIFSIPSN